MADFGLAAHIGGGEEANQMCGTPLFMAPEVVSGEEHDYSADIWFVHLFFYFYFFELIFGFGGDNNIVSVDVCYLMCGCACWECCFNFLEHFF